LGTTSFANPGTWELKASPQIALDKGWCSTWGAGHFFTFDDHAYDFLGTCNYVFAATCEDASPTFSVQLRRGPDGSISRIIVELGASVVTVNKATISIRDIGVVSLPYTSNGLQITPYGQSVQLVAKQLELELVVMWGPDTHLMVLVERKYMGRMCGLCGNFDGKTANEFLSEDGKLLEPHKYATLQKLDDPNEICSHETVPSTPILQATHAEICAQLLTLVSSECDVPKESLVLSCQEDMSSCTQPGQQNCSCPTLSEYSRRCRMAGQPVNNWRSPSLCSVGQCPANQVYKECDMACIRTCSNPQHSCSSACTFGCFCPDGMVLDDLSSNHTCVPISQCPCMHNGMIYVRGTRGLWQVRGLCPGHCSLEGGSFVTTFDARPYRFHGSCTYVLLQSSQLPDEGTLMAVYDKSGYSHSETSLVAIIYLSSKDKIVISEDEMITNHGDTKWLPYKTRNITIFRQTSTHLQMVTTFGLDLMIQLQPVFQVYITVEPQFRGQTKGLCGNFNGDTTDDFTTSGGIDEGTASLFVDSWRAGNCPAALERETDPCSMSQLNKVCAETHCSALLKKDSVFEKCHSVVNPKPFYKRCVYQACNYEETFPHICATLGAYAHTCASWGVLLWGWRSTVDNCTIPCTGNRTFSYDSQACNRTCLSLSDSTAECHTSPVPVDGCNCPEGTYLNHKAECVRKAQCPCLLDNNKFVLADQSTMVNGVICYCINGRLSCPRQREIFLESCPAPKTFQSCSQSSEDKFGAACAPTCQMLATGSACVPTKCESGCVCADGLYENTDGQCVPPEECPCDFAGVSYPGGAELHTDCKTCTCSQGRWTCQENAYCPSTCVLYGEGHIITFDGQRFVFEGNCEYILATDGCGANSSEPTFKILTENVICGKSGVTCSRAISIFIGGLSITMADRNYTVSGEDPSVHFQVKSNSLNLILDVGIPGWLNLTLIWNKHMSVTIKISRTSKDTLCGLCGNYNGNMKDDFETRSMYVASSELEFVNSWKENPLCGDASYVVDPCSLNTFRLSWAERKCSIINSQTFAACHSKVYHLPYYEACVHDTCGCDTGGDCECLCDAVAAYAQACLDKGVCVDWRAPDFCPVYCDFYNSHTQVGDSEYQYTQKINCTWHYQPCLCPGSLESFQDTNVEGCYNCSQDKYFDHNQGSCVPCSKSRQPGTSAPNTGSGPTEVPSTSATPSTTQFHSSSSSDRSRALDTSLGNAHGIKGDIPWLSSAESPRTTMAVTPLQTSPVIPTATPKSTVTGLTVTQATTEPTVSSLSQATKSTAQSTSRTTTAPLHHSATPGTSPSQGTSVTAERPVTTNPVTEHTEPPSLDKTTLTTQNGTGTPVAHTNSATPSSSNTPFTTHSSPSVPVSTTPHTTGQPTETSRQTSSTFSTPSVPQTSLSSVFPTFSTSSVTPTSHTITPSSSHTIPSSSTTRSTGTIPPTTQGTETTHSVTTQTPLSQTSTTMASSQTHSSFTTEKTSISLVSHSSSMPHHQSSSALSTTTTHQSTSSGIVTPLAHTNSATPSSSHTPFTTHSSPTIPVSTTTHTTGPPTETSRQTSSSYHTPTVSQTSLSSAFPTFSTSSVTPSSHTITPSSSHMVPSASVTRSTATIPPTTQRTQTTHSATTQTALPTSTTLATTQTHESSTTEKTSTSLMSHPSSTTHHQSTSAVSTTTTHESTSTLPLTSTTFTTTQTHGSSTTEKTSTSLVSHPSSTTHHQSTSAVSTTTTHESTSSGTVTSVAHTNSETPSSSHTPFTTHSSPTISVSTTPHTTGLPTESSFQTTSTFPTPSVPQTSLSSVFPTFSTSFVTSTSHTITPSSSHMVPSASVTRSTGTIPPTTQRTETTHSATTQTALLTSTSLATTQTHKSSTTEKTSTSFLSHPSSTTHHQSTSAVSTTTTHESTSSGTVTSVAHTNSATPSSSHTPFTTHSSPTIPVSTTTHTTGPPTETSRQTSSSYHTPTVSQTSLSSVFPTFSTSSVTQSSHTITPSSSHMVPSASVTRSTATIPPTTQRTQTTHSATTHTALPTSTTLATTQTHKSSTTEKTSTSFLSHPSSTTHHQSTTSPTPSVTQISLSSVFPTFSTSSVTPTSHTTITSSAHMVSSSSSPMPTGTMLPTSSTKGTGPTHTAPLMTSSTTATTIAHSSFSTERTSSVISMQSSSPVISSVSPSSSSLTTSLSPHLSLSTASVSSTNLPQSSPTLSHFPASSTSLLSTSRTTSHVPTSSTSSSQSTTSEFTSLTTGAPTSGLMSSTLAMTASPSSPVTILTTRPPHSTLLPTSVFLTSPSTFPESPSASTLESPSTESPSPIMSTSSPPGK
uniref:VWFD domain-containing protein n=1 Tax=Castor canadensis TaxID=51338 RepID=A0A8C0WJA0_CASCN